MKHLVPCLALASGVVGVIVEPRYAALHRTTLHQTATALFRSEDDTRGCSRQNRCLVGLARALDNRLPAMSRFCDQNKGAMTDDDRDLSLLPEGEDADSVHDFCKASGGQRSALRTTCACVEKKSTPGVKECRRALERKLGGAQAVTDFCYLATYGDVQTAANPYSNRTVLTDTEACSEFHVVVEVCQAAVPWNRRWKAPQCLQDECYVALEMFVGDSVQGYCKDMLAGRASSATGLRLAGDHCDYQRQLQACRCVAASGPEFGESQPVCQEKKCFQGLQEHFGRHAEGFCQTVLQGHDEHVSSGSDGISLPALAGDARQLGCRYRELIEACRCMKPTQERQHPACAKDECYGAIEEHYEGHKAAVESYCHEIRAMTSAESERDLRRYQFGPQCFRTTAVQRACSCVSRDWEIPTCVQDECYRGIDLAITGKDMTVFNFCTGVIRDPFRDPKTLLQGIDRSCPNAAALQKACECVVPPDDRGVWLGNLGPSRCYRNSCFSSVERSFKGDFHFGVVGFCRPTLRQLTLDASKVQVPQGCANTRELEEACACALPLDSDVWTSPKCIDNACYRSIDHHGPINSFCKTWRRSQETTAVSVPTFPGLESSCPGQDSIAEACACHEPYGSSDWAEPKCVENQCYASLDEALDQHPGVRRFCHELQWSRQNQLPAPEMPAGLGEACVRPEAVLEACNCVVAGDVELTESEPSSDDEEFLDTVCREHTCRVGLQQELGHQVRDVCQELVDGTPLEQQDLDDETEALLLARCEGVKPKLTISGYAREKKSGPIRRRDLNSGVQRKMMAACQCILSQPEEGS